MIEWRVIEQRDQVAWSDGRNPSTQAPRGVSGIVSGLLAVLTLVATGVMAVFAFSFLLVVVLPVMLIVGGVAIWRWRRLLRAQAELFRQQRSGQTDVRGEPQGQRYDRGRDDDGVIDV